MPNFQAFAPDPIYIEIYSFFTRRELLNGVYRINKKSAEHSKNELVIKKQILNEIGPDLKLLAKDEEKLIQTFDRNFLLLNAVKNEVINLLNGKSRQHLSVEKQKVLSAFHPHCILPPQDFLRFFDLPQKHYLLQQHSKKYPYLKDLLIKCLLYNLSQFVTHLAVLKKICNYFPDHTKLFMEKFLSEDSLLEKVFFSSEQIGFAITYFPNFHKEIMLSILNKKQISRLIVTLFDLENILSKANEFSADVMAIVNHLPHVQQQLAKNTNSSNSILRR